MLAQPGTITASLYSMLGVVLIFLTDQHHLLIGARSREISCEHHRAVAEIIS
jgi:hypothetical protein